ncbi:MAG: hypothetical protein ABIN04_01190 [Ginsengibacter sp.]
MKKIPFMLIMAMIISIITTKVAAQITAANFSKEQPGIFAAYLESSPKVAKKVAKFEKATNKALSNFKSSYNDESSVKWLFEPNIMVAKFTKDDIQTAVIYSKKGSWIHSIQNYNESKLPQNVRTLIKNSDFSNYNIGLVQQIDEGNTTFYIVHLLNGKKYKQVVVYDGSIGVLKESELQQ